MLNKISAAVIASTLVLSAASPALARTYVYYDQYGHKHYTHSQRVAANANARVQAPAPAPRNCASAGTKGAVIGGVGGALVGNAIGHDTKGTLIGAGVGAVAGHQIAKNKCR